MPIQTRMRVVRETEIDGSSFPSPNRVSSASADGVRATKENFPNVPLAPFYSCCYFRYTRKFASCRYQSARPVNRMKVFHVG